MTMKTTYIWECDSCGRSTKVREGESTPGGWQYVYGETAPRHVCSRRCAKTLLRAEMEATLDRWYPK